MNTDTAPPYSTIQVIPGDRLIDLDTRSNIQNLHTARNRSRHIISAWIRMGYVYTGTYFYHTNSFWAIPITGIQQRYYYSTQYTYHDVVYPKELIPGSNRDLRVEWKIPLPPNSYKCGPVSILIDRYKYRDTLDDKEVFHQYCRKIYDWESMEDYEEQLVLALMSFEMKKMNL